MKMDQKTKINLQPFGEVKKETTKNDNKFPKSVPLIIGNEFCERFCYYGMKAILTLYFVNVLKYDQDKSTEAFHLFAMFCYFTPILGAYIADSCLGKYLTILYLSTVYVFGNILIAFASYLRSEIVTMIGLALIALGTGGIKPCVSSFGGDQFKSNQTQLIRKFFSLFYLAINLGSFASMLVTPIFRNDISCFGQTTCYPLAFGVPALLMVVALILFIIGTPLYVKNPVNENAVLQFVSCVTYSLYKKLAYLFSSKQSPGHFLDYASGKYPSKVIKDSKNVLSVFLLFIPLPVFWSLFDQQGSRWVLQGEKTNGDLGFVNYSLSADQFQVINPIFIILGIPLFEFFIYPMLNKFNILTKPLQKMNFGGLLAAAAFLCAGVLEVYIDSSIPQTSVNGRTNLNIITFDQENLLSLRLNHQNNLKNLSLIYDKNIEKNGLFDLTTIDSGNYEIKFNFSQKKYSSKFSLKEKTFQTILLFNDGSEISSLIDEEIVMPNFEKIQLKIFLNVNSLKNELNSHKNFLKIKRKDIEVKNIEIISNQKIMISKLFELDEVKSGYDIYLNDKIIYNFLGKSGRYYDLVIESSMSINGSSHNSNYQYNIRNFELINFKPISILWQSFQYIIITVSEIMFSITGLEFSYSQAPKSMKSVVSAVFLLTTALGNLIVVIITKYLHFESQANLFFFYSVLMILDILLLIVLSYFYKPIEEEDSE